ncbi:MAG: hypothetical protein J6X30_00205, partial [Clostridia bacterium]|nr:hypothetical protein [Clostridia bacterium]
DALLARGHDVDLVDEQPSHGGLARILMRRDSRLYHRKTEAYFRRVLSSLKPCYDEILFIKCEAPTARVLEAFHTRYPAARFQLYLWDSIANMRHITDKFRFFDRIFSFDEADVARDPRLRYAYWGFTKEYDVSSPAVPSYDLAFVGTLHSIRPVVLEKIKEECARLHLRFYCFVYNPHPLYFYYNKLFNRCFRHVKKSDVSFQPLTVQETVDVYRNARAVLEIENSFQTGATTRLGEMLGMNKKLVTTVDCRQAPFYRKENQLVIDPKEPCLDPAFFSSPYQPIPEEIRYAYSFEAFLDTVFCK